LSDAAGFVLVSTVDGTSLKIEDRDGLERRVCGPSVLLEYVGFDFMVGAVFP
jgi:hypothetical protein